MSDLTPFQRKFVLAYCANGGNGAQAALAAGYAEGSARQRASELVTNPRILAAIREETERRLRSGVALGAKVLLDLAENAESEAVRLKAAEALLDRGGLLLIARSETVHRVIDERSDEELLARLRALSGELGLPFAKMIEGDAEEIRPPNPGSSVEEHSQNETKKD